MELKRIIKSTSFLVLSKVVQFLIGVLKAKVGAIYLGTIGIGIYNQVSYLTTMVSQITLLSMNDGLVKQIAQEKESPDFKEILKGLIKSYSILIVFSVILAFAVCLFFARSLTVFFLGDVKYLTYYLIGVAGIPIIIINSLSFALLKSFKATKGISVANILSAALSFCFYIPLVYYFNILGAIVAVVVSFTIVLFINNYQARKLILGTVGISFKELFNAKADIKYSNELLHFALYGATSGLIYLGAEGVCRSLLVNGLGVEKLGLYSPIIAWSGLLTGFIMPAIQVYLFPRFSECKSNEEISGIINDYFYLINFVMIPFLFLSIPLRNGLIQIFYSNEFIEAGQYLPGHFIGLLFFMYWSILSISLTPTGRIKTHGIFVTMLSFTNIAIVYYLVPIYGLYGWMLKFVISPVLFTFIYFFYLNAKIGLTISIKNISLMLYSVSVSLLLLVLDDYKAKYYLSIFFIGLSVVFMSKHERSFVLKKIRQRF
jgi:O-antigen/teichoic acid export membrane protein